MERETGTEEQDKQHKRQGGFAVIELLIATVVVGIPMAVAIVGIGGRVNNDGKSACNASADAAHAPSAVHFANTNTFSAMTGPTPPEYELPSGVTTPDAVTVKHGTDWTLTLESQGATETTFKCTFG